MFAEKTAQAAQAAQAAQILNAESYYDVLGVSQNADLQVIRKAYRRLVLEYHPDKNASSYSSEIFIRISEAFDTLRDRDKRFLYDTEVYAQKNEVEEPSNQSETQRYEQCNGEQHVPSNPYGVPEFYTQQAYHEENTPRQPNAEPKRGYAYESKFHDFRPNSIVRVPTPLRNRAGNFAVSTVISKNESLIVQIAKWKSLWEEECRLEENLRTQQERYRFESRTRDLEESSGLQLFGQVTSAQRARAALQGVANNRQMERITQASILSRNMSSVWNAEPFNERLKHILDEGILPNHVKQRGFESSDLSDSRTLAWLQQRKKQPTAGSNTQDTKTQSDSLPSVILSGQTSAASARDLRNAMEVLVAGERMLLKARSPNVQNQNSHQSQFGLARHTTNVRNEVRYGRRSVASASIINETRAKGRRQSNQNLMSEMPAPSLRMEIGSRGEKLIPVSVWLSSDFQKLQWRLVGSQSVSPDGVVYVNDIDRINVSSPDSSGAFINIITPLKTLSLKVPSRDKADYWSNSLNALRSEWPTI